MADSIADYLKSPSNRKLLYTFAVEKLPWANKTALSHAINMCLDDAIATAASKYTTWQLTPENIAEVNAEIYKSIKPVVEKSLHGIVQNPETELADRFKERTKPQTFEKSDGVIQDRELESLRETYMSSWR